ncbi:MAG TPA: hypothetical protein VFV49_03605 [Thermoanaerobaculia bacterium]|nr:hypothetical protein [Thermoanaerobaculia bacterium]
MLLALVVSLSLSCQRSEPSTEHEQMGAASPEAHFIDRMPADVAAILANPTNVRFLRIVNSFDVPASEYAALKSAKPDLAGYPVTAEVQGTPEQARALGQALLRRGSYLGPTTSWMCIFEPHHIAQLSKGKDAVNVIICFKCGEIELRLPGETTEGAPQGLSNQGAKRLYEIVGKVFPENPK